MRYPGSEKLEIIRLVERSHLSVRRTLATLGILPMTFYRWYARLQAGGPEALEDKPSRPKRVWNKIPEEVRDQIVELALDEPELSPREVATRFTDVKKYFVSEASVYRLLKAHDLITSPAFIVVKAADEFKVARRMFCITDLYKVSFAAAVANTLNSFTKTASENRSVGGSIPPLGTISHFKQVSVLERPCRSPS